MFGETYESGLDILGAVTIPSVGANYTDHDTVLAVQSALKDKGFNPGKLDGVMGSNTAKAIRAAQSAAGIPQTGIIDEGVISMLKVTPGVLPPGVTAAAKADVEAAAAVDAAKAADNATTSQEIQAAAAKVVDAVPADQPALKQAAQTAHVAAVIATTPAQVQAAKQQVQAVAQQVQAAAGAPSTPWWEWAILGAGGLAVVGGGAALLFGGRRRKGTR